MIRISEKDKADLMTFKEMRERLLNKDKIREQQLKEEKEEEDKERREERARLEKIRKEEKRAAGEAKWESEFRQLIGEGEIEAVSTLSDTPESSQNTPIKLTPHPSSYSMNEASMCKSSQETSENDQETVENINLGTTFLKKGQCNSLMDLNPISVVFPWSVTHLMKH